MPAERHSRPLHKVGPSFLDCQGRGQPTSWQHRALRWQRRDSTWFGGRTEGVRSIRAVSTVTDQTSAQCLAEITAAAMGSPPEGAERTACGAGRAAVPNDQEVGAGE